jgi:energy-coupling factor transporter ATP-binding protein EcfA2
MSSTLASRHFRNQLNLLYDEAFPRFKDISESTWPGLAIQELRGQGRRQGTELELMVRDEDFVAEVAWMGHGLQMWLQTMWFLARCGDFDTVILDEPDVYMHADLQRRLIRFLKDRHPQVIIATHSIEIMSEVDPENILMVDREKRQAEFTTDIPQVQQVVDQIGGIQNLNLTRLWDSRRCLFIEGKDVALLKQFQNTLFRTSAHPIDAIPNLSVGGWGGWHYAVGSSMLLRTAIGQEIKPYCIFDSDFHTPNQIAARNEEAAQKAVILHIWTKKELENYVLVPEAILRTLSAKARDTVPRLSAELIAQKLFEFAGELEDEVMDAFAAEYFTDNRSGGMTQANRSARERMAADWNTTDGRLSLVSGKRLLARLSEWTQENYGVTISAVRVARAMRRTEIPDEIVRVITAIEDNESF